MLTQLQHTTGVQIDNDTKPVPGNMPMTNIYAGNIQFNKWGHAGIHNWEQAGGMQTHASTTLMHGLGLEMESKSPYCEKRAGLHHVCNGDLWILQPHRKREQMGIQKDGMTCHASFLYPEVNLQPFYFLQLSQYK